MGRLQDKVCIITGAAGGMGLCALDIFSQEGANVVGVDIKELDEGAASMLASRGGTFVKSDVTDEKAVDALIQLTIKKYGKIDVLYNNHGIILGKPALETTMEEYDHVVNVDQRSVFMLSLYAAREMVKNKSGSIINVSSVGGLVGYPDMTAYGIAKGAVCQMARNMAMDLGRYGIRVNTICPGSIDTPMPHKYMEGMTPEEKAASIKMQADMSILKRFGQPKEVVYLSLFLASDEASFMTGAVIPVDGGLTAI